MPPTLPHWDWQAKRGTLAGVVRPPLLRMNWSVKDVMIQSWEEAGDSRIVTLRTIWPNFWLLFWHTHAHPLITGLLAWQDMANGGQNFTLCDALVASERRLVS